MGVPTANLFGVAEVQGNIVRDLAALNSVETLPWDMWGMISTQHEKLSAADLDLLDQAAALSAAASPLSLIKTTLGHSLLRPPTRFHRDR